MSEGKSTGIPTIQEELRNNGSPKARFFTDDDRRAVTVEIPIHEDFLRRNDTVNDIVNDTVNLEYILQEYIGNKRTNIEKLLLEMKNNSNVSIDELPELITVSRRTVTRYIKELKDKGIVEREDSDKSGRWIVKM